MINELKAIQLIQQKIDEIDIDQFTIGVDRDKIFSNWKNSTYELLVKIFSKDYLEVSKFGNISWGGRVFYKDGSRSDIIPHRVSGIKNAQQILKQCIDDIKTGLLITPNTQIPNIVVNNHNQQSQEMNVRIDINYVFSNLDEKERQELKDQLKKYQYNKDMNGFIDYLKTLGQGVVESVLANILTNPMFINQILQQI
jgi:hypothetical protein